MNARERISYDGNGNILTYLRKGNATEFDMDDHKHISSTEKYAMQELDGLEDQLIKHHPFG